MTCQVSGSSRRQLETCKRTSEGAKKKKGFDNAAATVTAKGGSVMVGRRKRGLAKKYATETESNTLLLLPLQ